MSFFKKVKLVQLPNGNIQITDVVNSLAKNTDQQYKKKIAKAASEDPDSPFYGMNLETATAFDLYFAVQRHANKNTLAKLH